MASYSPANSYDMRNMSITYELGECSETTATKPNHHEGANMRGSELEKLESLAFVFMTLIFVGFPEV